MRKIFLFSLGRFLLWKTRGAKTRHSFLFFGYFLFSQLLIVQGFAQIRKNFSFYLARLLLWFKRNKFFKKLFEGNKFMASTSAISSGTIQTDYIKLLVEQLKNQDPTNPLDNNQMASQLAQFSELQQLETMNSKFADVLKTNQLMYASSLVGKQVTYQSTAEDGTTTTNAGMVQGVGKDSDGNIILSVGGYAVGLDDVVSIQ
jgi:flagellar basal-body rod modification protein FlgD